MSQAHTTGKVLAGTVGAVGLLLATGQAANAASVTVKSTDTVWSLAQQHGVSVKSIEKLNKIQALDENTDLIYVGQKLQISGKSSQSSTTKSNNGTYTVKAGDTLWALADKYNTSVHALQKLNGLSGDLIVVGQALKVPSTTAKTTKATTTSAKTVAKAAASDTTTAVSSTSSSATTSTAASSSNDTVTTNATSNSSSASSKTASSSQASASSSVVVSSTSSSAATSESSSTASSVASASSNSTSAATSSSSTTSASSVSSSSAASSSASVSAASASSSEATSSSSTEKVTATVYKAAASSSSAASQSSSTATSSSSTATSSTATSSSSAASQSSSTATSSSSTATSTSSAATSSAATSSTTSAATSSASTASSTAATTNSSSSTTTSSSDLATGSVTGLAVKLASANIPYVWGGASLSGMDCSGLVQYVYLHAAGISLPHSTVGQESYVSIHSVADAQPGDILFWGSRGASYHDAIYLGNNQFVAAPTEGENVKVQSFTSDFMPSFAGTVNQ
ncbi:gamma-D-glutamate-meso-diaminopimelate muropeptidase [Lactiplantibacillus fabifermentans T30PCM01]|uniref:Gamma-D-glutamate-meso-diaminopimelate muropeptidase n=1 Tax=Lactiplantibacillus fabifermentans T30PCM01 TaxID=1400520 RepID=W6T6S3_9LACO|nr:C40 family peptidase [Lactiplantibacillus fabifermentans]ETY73907.1 gamma-D-glutamate-meso-diaminopimelate muropeptidase [Lactiplantibacillus fabifermentans T30PCM01]